MQHTKHETFSTGQNFLLWKYVETSHSRIRANLLLDGERCNLQLALGAKMNVSSLSANLPLAELVKVDSTFRRRPSIITLKHVFRNDSKTQRSHVCSSFYRIISSLNDLTPPCFFLFFFFHKWDDKRIVALQRDAWFVLKQRTPRFWYEFDCVWRSRDLIRSYSYFVREKSCSCFAVLIWIWSHSKEIKGTKKPLILKRMFRLFFDKHRTVGWTI